MVGDALDALLSREPEAHSLEFRLRRRLIVQEVGILNGLASSRSIDAYVVDSHDALDSELTARQDRRTWETVPLSAASFKLRSTFGAGV